MIEPSAARAKEDVPLLSSKSDEVRHKIRNLPVDAKSIVLSANNPLIFKCHFGHTVLKITGITIRMSDKAHI